MLKKKILSGIMALIMIFGAYGCTADDKKGSGNEFTNNALALAKLVYNDYFIDLGEGDTYIKYFSPSKAGEPDKAYLWPYMEVVAMNARLMTIVGENTLIGEGKTVKQFYTDTINGFKYYKSNRTDYTTYTASRAQLPDFGSGDTYYDDNLWVAREFVNAYQLLGNEEYLTSAKKVTEFVLSGWDSVHGGIRWFDAPDGVGHKDYGETRNTCSNAPTVILLCRLYDITKEQSYLDWAKRIYAFTKDNLMDTDGTYFDNVKWDSKTGKDIIEPTKWTYNSGSMISAGVMLYERETNETEKAAYLADAKKTAKGSHDIFAVDMDYSANVYPSQPWFNLLLLDGFLEIYRYDAAGTKPYIDSYYDSLAYGYKKNRDSNGYVAPNWVGGWTDKNKEPKSVLDMAANSENYGLMAYAMDKLDYKR